MGSRPGQPRIAVLNDFTDVVRLRIGETDRVVRSVRQVSYYWDKQMCWIDDTRLALGGIDADDQAMIPGVEIYDVSTGALTAAFAGPDGDLHCDGDQLYAASPGGMTIWDIRTGRPPVPCPVQITYDGGL